jgi:plastocyanin domain-containing protein
MKKLFISGIASLGLVFGGAANAQVPHNMEAMPEQMGQFRHIEQPLANKVLVTSGGLGLIGLELWWFLLSKPKSRKAPGLGGDSKARR